MRTILVVDACSIFDFQKFYIFDKYNGKNIYSKLINFILSKIKSGEIIIIDKVYGEINTNSYTEKLKKALKPFIVDTLFLFPKVEELIKNNFREEIVRFRGYNKQEIEQQIRQYEEKYADLYLIAYCNYLKEQKIKPILITEETFNDDKKIIEKIPTICKKEKIEFRKIPYSLFEIYKDDLNFDLTIVG